MWFQFKHDLQWRCDAVVILQTNITGFVEEIGVMKKTSKGLNIDFSQT